MYRIVVKIISILLHVGTDVVRENLLLAMVVVAITMAICSTAYEVVVRTAPWIVGKKKVKENKLCQNILEQTASVEKPELH